jgi:monooxygenase
MKNTSDHFDVLIVGAGISGIGAACHLRKKSPNRSFAILENRANIGGTWDLFRYPGIRSDSDMYTLGYSFKPWKEGDAIASGDSILKYLNETIDENQLRDTIQFESKVTRANWSPKDARWTLDIRRGDGETSQLSCNYLYMCSGYYNYDQGYLPEFKGYGDYKGVIAHPQHWTPDLDYKGKRVIVIGSGATAVTLIPEMAKDAAHITMLQRSPSYVVSRPQQDKLANGLRKWLPNWLAYKITRTKNVLLNILFYNLTRRYPQAFKKRMVGMVETELGPEFDIKKHFTPSYDPWDQRVCAVPDSDLFEAIKEDHVSVVTDHIDHFTAGGIKLKSGEELEADMIVPATGLSLLALGGMVLAVDGTEVIIGKTTYYKGMTLSNVPNFAWTVGYTNASWTLKADLTADYVCRLLNHMEKKGYTVCTPALSKADAGSEPMLDFSSGYIQRSIKDLPKQGTVPPWKNHQNYIADLMHLKFGTVDDGVMKFTKS